MGRSYFCSQRTAAICSNNRANLKFGRTLWPLNSPCSCVYDQIRTKKRASSVGTWKQFKRTSMSYTRAVDSSKAIDEITSSLKGKKLVLFLDYDGTLAEVNAVPDETYMTKDMTGILAKVTSLDQVLPVAISGRKTEDVQERVGLDTMMYCGNHGLEMCLSGSGMTYNLNDEELLQLRTGIKNIIAEMKEHKLGKECGGNIEDKDTALTWHFFNVPESEVDEIVDKASTIVKKNGFPIFDGHGCIEVRHPRITKGDAMKKILYDLVGTHWHETHQVVFIGDSSSDEEGFAALVDDHEFRSDCFTFIKIQSEKDKPTKGKYIFNGCDDVYSLLDAINQHYSGTEQK